MTRREAGVLYLADIRFPLERANGVQTAHTCAALAECGLQVSLLVRPDTHDPPRDPLTFYGLDATPGLSIERAAVRGGASARRAQYVSAAIGRMLRAPQPAIVYTRDLGVASIALRLPSRFRPPIVYESHGYAPAVSQDAHLRLSTAAEASARTLHRLEARERRVWSRADGYVAITRTLADELTATFGGRARLIVAPDGVRLPADRRFTPPTRRSTPTVGYGGHLYPWKGVDTLLDALAQLPGMRGLIVGGLAAEPDLHRLRQRARDLGLDGRIDFTGHLEPPAVAGRLAEADILVLPNRRTTIAAQYTSPLKLFEYMALGKPIVAADLAAIREVLRHEENALLTPPDDPAALAASLTRAAEDLALAERIARCAFDDVRRYTWRARAEALLRLFDALLTAPGVRGAAR
jgi:glycosyltransferase involved in cell wall biosynthesis